ncbi:MAG: hypothetical protein UY04_C0005G0010 [Parcubacteria group bacterium GW2011_GWA2_47_7]|nr:MAG: hypothetical protein UY04_C0005G0010 [Parcubacteria group bacterium GW2011_GWA2_47_7]
MEKHIAQRRPAGMSVDEKKRVWNTIEQGLTFQSLPFSYTTLWKNTRIRFAAIIFGLLMLSGGAATAYASNAKPGDILFPVLVAQEKAQILFVGDEAKKEELRVQFAHKRLSEVRELAALADETLDDKGGAELTHEDATSSRDIVKTHVDPSLETMKREERVKRGREIALRELEVTRALFDRDGKEKSRNTIDDIITEIHAVSPQGERSKIYFEGEVAKWVLKENDQGNKEHSASTSSDIIKKEKRDNRSGTEEETKDSGVYTDTENENQGRDSDTTEGVVERDTENNG